MRLYPDRIPELIPRLFDGLLWHKDRLQNKVYLTFDDGPTPEVTKFVLDLLRKYDFKATFFCIGDCVQKHPDLFTRILNENHALGNHTYNHLNAWKNSNEEYLDNIDQAAQLIDSRLFRPPYGRITPSLSKSIMEEGYQIIMWDVLSGDFDLNRTSESCLENIVDNTQNGSIIVFHDSLKAQKHLRQILPEYLQFLKDEGFECCKIIQENTLDR
ncbi:MAG: polysaccharide deacetylase family protein [Nonlabens sp.]